MNFRSEAAQVLLGSVIMMPQKDSFEGGFGMPMNSFAILRMQGSILFDSPFSWTMDAMEELIGLNCAPLAVVLSHRDVAAAGDAFYEIREHYELPFYMHPDDRGPMSNHLPFRLEDVTSGTGAKLLVGADITVLHLPGHTPGSVMLYVADAGGILLTGDCAVGRGPNDSEETPHLRRPPRADRDPNFLPTWESFGESLPLAAIGPLHGAFCRRSDLGDAAFDAAVANIWQGDAWTPAVV